MRQIFAIIMIVVVVIFGVAWYISHSRARSGRTGPLVVHTQPGTNKNAAAPSGSGGANPANQPAQTDQPTQPQPAPAAGAPASSGQQDTQTSSTAPSPGAQQQGQAVAPPPADSIARNPPSGMIFAGTGKYQLYRQGDITWRLNTDSGEACILFATDTQWRKPRVYQRGCGAS